MGNTGGGGGGGVASTEPPNDSIFVTFNGGGGVGKSNVDCDGSGGGGGGGGAGGAGMPMPFEDEVACGLLSTLVGEGPSFESYIGGRGGSLLVVKAVSSFNLTSQISIDSGTLPLQSTVERIGIESVDSPGVQPRSILLLEELSCSSKVDDEDKNADSILIPLMSARVGLSLGGRTTSV